VEKLRVTTWLNFIGVILNRLAQKGLELLSFQADIESPARIGRRLAMLSGALLALALLSPPAPTPASSGGYLYRATLLQAAPGKLLEVVDLYKAGWPGLKDSGDEAPIAMRHSQGDRWDLLLLFPMGSYEQFYSPDRVARRAKAAAATRAGLERLAADTARQEDVFVLGPPLEEVRGKLGDAGLFHIEMFEALPGQRAGLYKEREMENAYAKALGEPENLIFVRDAGAAWDLFTVGPFRDLKHYAESADVPAAKQEDAAKAAGFEGARFVGPYLRTFIALHHDTLAVAVR
jgi:hypothetical protein